MRGYKAFNKDLTCMGMQYEVGKEYKFNGEPIPCRQGFHFCETIADCYEFYPMNDDTRICEVEATGDIAEDGVKRVTNVIKILAEITCDNLRKGNTGTSNSGYRNSGDSNSGDWNSGNSNSGDRNSGYSNSGDWNCGNSNSGNSNSGDWNSGNSNSGDWNSGDRNSGDRNSGNRNSGDSNSGYRNSGNRNSGVWNSGNRNSGDRNSGYRNSGDSNSGDWNSGNRNSGDRNSGVWNSGDWNSGNRNSGYRNSGDWNSGDWNSGNRNSGVFCTEKQPTIKIFDVQTDWTFDDWIDSEAYRVMSKCPYSYSDYIGADDMTDEEKERHPEYKTIGGYVKTFTATAEDKQKWWDSLSERDKNEVKELPNFDADKFCECVGIEHL